MTDLASTRPREDLEHQLERHRRELTGYCYRMMGSSFEAEDAVQETMIRAWKGYDRFEGRAALRSWLYRIATNVCLDMLNGRQRRARPMDLGAEPVEPGDAVPGAMRPEATWIEPIPTGRVVPDDGDPGEVAVARESVTPGVHRGPPAPPAPPAGRADPPRGAALEGRRGRRAARHDRRVGQQRPAAGPGHDRRQRPRPRPTLPEQVDDDQEPLLSRYLDAFQRYDMDALTALIHEDATQSMPPYELWLAGRDDMLAFWVGPGACVPRLPARPDHGQRPAGVRPVPAEPATAATSRGRCRSSRSPTARSPT